MKKRVKVWESCQRLLAQDLIAMTLPDKPQSRLQRYRLTAQGRALLAALQTQENP